MLYNLLAAAGSNALCSHIPIKQAVADLLKARIHQNKWLRHHYSTIYNPLMGLRVGATQCRLQSASLLLEGAASLGWELPFSSKKNQAWMVRKGAEAHPCEGTCGVQHATGPMTTLWQVPTGLEEKILCLSFSPHGIRSFHLPSPLLLPKMNLVGGERSSEETEGRNWEEDYVVPG